jgi:hypothetical protein
MLSCKKVDFVPVVYEWYPLEYQLPIPENNYYYLEPEYLGIFFRDSRTGFISVRKEFTLSGRDLFLRTDDSCKSFIDLSTLVPGFVSHMCFVSDSIMYLASKGDNLYKSRNGGLVWEEIDAPDYHDISNIFSNPNGNLFVVYEEIQTLWFSNDGGITWAEQFKGKDPSHEDLTDLDIQFIGATQDTGFINFEDTLFISTDGGSSWNDYLYDSLYGFEEYKFLDFKTVYVHFQDEFYKSTDSGKTFINISSLGYYYKWQIISENEFYCSRHYIYSEFTTIFQSSDEFRTQAMMDFWHSPDDKTYNYRPEVYVITGSKEGYAICSSGKLYKLHPASD